jgi:hypothetical protein
MTMPENDCVEIREGAGLLGARMLIVDEPSIIAVHDPGDSVRSEAWRIVVGADLEPAVIHSEASARAWLTFLATNLNWKRVCPDEKR